MLALQVEGAGGESTMTDCKTVSRAPVKGARPASIA
jgi:hypothetical protein